MIRNSIQETKIGEQPRDEASVARRRVLVADDQARILGAAAALLEGTFDVIAVVPDGRSAIEATLELEPDLVVLDISMPGMTGIEVARELRKRSSRTKIVFLTVHEDPQILASCLAVGGLGYVVKDVMDSDLIVAANAALAGRVFVSRFSSEQGTD